MLHLTCDYSAAIVIASDIIILLKRQVPSLCVRRGLCGLHTSYRWLRGISHLTETANTMALCGQRAFRASCWRCLFTSCRRLHEISRKFCPMSGLLPLLRKSGAPRPLDQHGSSLRRLLIQPSLAAVPGGRSVGERFAEGPAEGPAESPPGAADEASSPIRGSAKEGRNIGSNVGEKGRNTDSDLLVGDLDCFRVEGKLALLDAPWMGGPDTSEPLSALSTIQKANQTQDLDDPAIKPTSISQEFRVAQDPSVIRKVQETQGCRDSAEDVGGAWGDGGFGYIESDAGLPSLRSAALTINLTTTVAEESRSGLGSLLANAKAMVATSFPPVPPKPPSWSRVVLQSSRLKKLRIDADRDGSEGPGPGQEGVSSSQVVASERASSEMYSWPFPSTAGHHPSSSLRTTKTKALARAELESNLALKDLREDYFAKTSRAPKSSRKSSVLRIAGRLNKGKPVFPLDRKLLEKVAAVYKRANYKSGSAYLLELKLAHVEMAGLGRISWREQCGYAKGACHEGWGRVKRPKR